MNDDNGGFVVPCRSCDAEAWHYDVQRIRDSYVPSWAPMDIVLVPRHDPDAKCKGCGEPPPTTAQAYTTYEQAWAQGLEDAAEGVAEVRRRA